MHRGLGRRIIRHVALPDYGILLLRVTLGGLFVAHLAWKLLMFEGGVGGWSSALVEAGYPAFVPYYVLSAEIAGALLLIPGFWTRWVSLYAVPMMIGASHFWLARKGFYFTAAGAELPLLWTILLVTQGLLGDGPHALAPSPSFPVRLLAKSTK